MWPMEGGGGSSVAFIRDGRKKNERTASGRMKTARSIVSADDQGRRARGSGGKGLDGNERIAGPPRLARSRIDGGCDTQRETEERKEKYIRD